MRKYENFCNALSNMKDIYNYEEPYDNVVITGLVGLYEICFEQSWKMMKEILEIHGYAAVSSAASTDAGPDNTIPDINVRHKNLVRYLFFIYLNCSLLTVSMSLPPVYKGILSKLLFTLLCYFISKLSQNINLFYSSIIIF